jgi:hypothetical protein
MTGRARRASVERLAGAIPISDDLECLIDLNPASIDKVLGEMDLHQ